LIPVHTGTPEQFRAIREFLTNAAYTESATCERLGISAISAFIDGERPSFPQRPPDALDLVIRSFFLGAYILSEQARTLFPPEAFDAFLETRLLTADEVHPHLLYSPVMLYPAFGILAASDRYTRPDGEPLQTGDDFVFPGISPHSGHFLSILPETRCQRFLDVGAGTGIAALGAAARYAGHAWSLDITARATEYAVWNKGLNGIENLTVLQGDMFAPVTGLTFDRIVMHPPYDVSLGHRPVYCNGGDDGEYVVRRLFQEVGPFLAPGGRLYVVARIADLFRAPLEMRVREWLGEWSDECDVVIISRDLTSPDEVALATFVSSRASHDELAEYKLRLHDLGIEQLCYGCVVVQKRREQRPVFTVRRERGADWGSPAIEWLLALQTGLTADPGGVWKLPLRTPADLSLVVRHEMSEARLSPSQYTLELKNPFRVEMEVQKGIVNIVSNCGQGRTPADLYRDMTAQGLFPSEAGEGAFLEIVSELISAGLLQPAAFRAPVGKQPAEAIA
jgi:SAM-dependent methyltransferase